MLLVRRLSSDPSLFLEKTAGGLALLRLNRPDRKNAFGSEMVGRLGAVLSSLDNETRVLIVQSDVDGCFSAGADLKVLTPHSGSSDIWTGTCRHGSQRRRPL